MQLSGEVEKGPVDQVDPGRFSATGCGCRETCGETCVFVTTSLRLKHAVSLVGRLFFSRT